MKEILQDSFIKSLEGHYSHIDPEKALSGLNPELARKKIEGFQHSIWDLLHHIATWQGVVIDSITDKEIDWDNINQNQNWPTDETKRKDENFDLLLLRFKEDLRKIKDLTKTVDFSNPISSWNDKPVIQALMVAITHNSYHFGQILTLKRAFQVMEEES
jgi:uncharacterized damage-inducible protein DinB